MISVRSLLHVPDDDRDKCWLLDALQTAVQLELATMPPYLTAKWSVMDQDSEVVDAIDSIVREEMLHMGFVCNVMNALKAPPGGRKISPRIADSAVVPGYPVNLPGEVIPDLIVPLERLSKALVRDVFMAIEKPEFAPVTFSASGQPYPTIGAFYEAVFDALLALDASDFENPPRRQRSAIQVKLEPVTSQIDALRAISLIKKQGEGTAIGPYFDPHKPNTVAHYYRFGEIYHERRLRIADYKIVYDGKCLPFPREGRIYPMAPVPKGGYTTKDACTFNERFSDLLRNLEAAWSLDDNTEAKAKLKSAIDDMNSLGAIATRLMSTKVAPSSAATYGPGFVYVA